MKPAIVTCAESKTEILQHVLNSINSFFSLKLYLA